MFRYVALRNLFPWRAIQGGRNISHYGKDTSPDYSYVVVRSPELDEMKGGTGWVTFEKRIGDKVSEEEVVARVDTDRYIVSVYSPVEGVLDEVYVQDGTKIRSHQGMFRVRQEPDEYLPVSHPVQKRRNIDRLKTRKDLGLPEPEHELPPQDYGNRTSKELHHWSKPGESFKCKSDKLRNRYRLDTD